MDYGERVVIQRHGGIAKGTRNHSTGQYTAPASGPVILYDGPADVQHRTRGRRRGEDGQTVTQSDADVYFPPGALDMWSVDEGAWVLIGHDSTRDVERVGRVVTVDHLSEMCSLAFVTPTMRRIVTEDLGAVLVTEDGTPLKW